MEDNEKAVELTRGEILCFWLIYLIFWAVSYSSFLAHQRHEYYNINTCREDMAFSMFFAAIPIVGWIAPVVMTGFYENGLQFTCIDDRR